MNSKNKGIYFALLTTLISGISVFLNKYAVGLISPPLVLTAVRNFSVGAIIVGFILSSGKWKVLKEYSKRDFVNLGLVALVGGTIPFYLFFTGLTMIPAINAALIHKSLVLWVALLAIPFLHESLTKKQAVGVGLLFLSNVFIGGFKGFEFSTGELFILIATLFWAVENIIAKKALKTIDPDILTGARMGGGSLVLLGAALITTPQSFAALTNFSLMQLGIFAATTLCLLGFVTTWYRALKLAPASLVTGILVGATLVTNVLSAVFVTKTIEASLIPQALMLVLGIVILVNSFKTAEQATLQAQYQ